MSKKSSLRVSNFSVQTRYLIIECDLISYILLFDVTCAVYKAFYRQGCRYRHGVTEMQCEIIIKREEAAGRTYRDAKRRPADAICLPRLRPRLPTVRKPH